MTQQATQPVTKTFTHVHDLEEAKMRASTAFAFYREKDAEAGAGVNPTFAWRGNGSVADVSFTVNKTRLTGTVLITASSMPGVSKDGTMELAVNVPADLRLFAPMMVNVVAKEVEGWLTMKDL